MFHPSILAIPLLALAYRIRGHVEGFPDLGGTQLTRIFAWGLPVALWCHFVTERYFMPDVMALHVWLFTWFASTIGHSSEQADDIGENLKMGLVTALMLVVTLAPLAVWAQVHDSRAFAVDFAEVLPLGFLGAPAYILGYRIPWTLRVRDYVFCRARSTEWGELLTGALAFGLPIALLGW